AKCRRTLIMQWLLILPLLCAAAACGQVSQPILGYVPDGSHLRPVLGIPAAAAVSDVVNADQDFARIAVSPGKNYVLGSEGGSGCVSILKDGILTPVNGASASPDQIAISPRGSAAALLYTGAGRVQVVTGLPGAPTIRDIGISFMDGAPSNL